MERGLKILVAEDDPGVREGLCELVAEAAEPVPAKTFAEAMAALAHERFALVMTDLMIDGSPEAGWQIVNEARRRAMPVVVASGSRPKRVPAEAQAQALLEKPFSVDEVLGLVERFTGLSGEAQRKATSGGCLELAAGARVPVQGGRSGQAIYVLSGRLVRGEVALGPGQVGFLCEGDAPEWRAEVPSRIAGVPLIAP